MMAKFIDRTTIILSILSVLFFLLTNYIETLTKKPTLKISKEEVVHTIGQDFLEAFSVGQQRMLSGYLWISTLLQSDIDRHGDRNIRSWMYYRFKAIAALDKNFYLNYKFGGMYLSIVKDDIDGSIYILKRGLEQFSDDFWLHYYMGFNYLYELGNQKSALYYFDRIKFHPMTKLAAPYLPSIVAKLQTEKGNLEVAFTILYSAYRKTPDESSLKKHFEGTLYSLRAEIDLKCLNSGGSRCQKLDFLGHPYIKTPDGSYRTIRKLSPTKLTIKARSKGK